MEWLWLFISKFGGMPFNLINLDREARLWHNLHREILSPAGSLFAEPLVQLHEEICTGYPALFMRVLAAIAQGYHRRTDIANRAALPDARQVDHYLTSLIELGLVECRTPRTRQPAKRNWGLYHFSDPRYRFWHRWVLPRREVLEIGHGLETIQIYPRQKHLSVATHNEYSHEILLLHLK